MPQRDSRLANNTQLNAHRELQFFYKGDTHIDKTKIAMEKLPSIYTEIKMILGNPDASLSCASFSTKGVGLVQQELVFTNHIGIHPNVVLFPEKVSK